LNARHDTLLALASSVPWPVRLHTAPPEALSPTPPEPSREATVSDPPPDQLPLVRDPSKSIAC